MIDAQNDIVKAAKRGDIAAVKSLLATDAALVHARDTDASTPLH
jgi:hypothetical protein